MADLLLVDDDVEYAESFADILCLRGHTVRLASNGAEGLAQLTSGYPDAVLLDVDMPILTGPEMAWRMFLANLGREKIPIVLLSANFDLAAVAARCGTPYFLAKPFELQTMFALLDRALGERTPPSWPPR